MRPEACHHCVDIGASRFGVSTALSLCVAWRVTGVRHRDAAGRLRVLLARRSVTNDCRESPIWESYARAVSDVGQAEMTQKPQRWIEAVAAALVLAPALWMVAAGSNAAAQGINVLTVATAEVERGTRCELTVANNESEHEGNLLRIVEVVDGVERIVLEIADIEASGTAFTTRTWQFTASGSVRADMYYTHRSSVTGNILNCNLPPATPTPTPPPTPPPTATATPVPITELRWV